MWSENVVLCSLAGDLLEVERVWKNKGGSGNGYQLNFIYG